MNSVLSVAIALILVLSLPISLTSNFVGNLASNFLDSSAQAAIINPHHPIMTFPLKPESKNLNSSPVPGDTLTEGVTKTVLKNGLTVLTKEINTAPVATVQVWYRVGSRNEKPGITGISHQLEHLMFKGTKDRPIQFGRLFSALGSSSNAFTSYDMTAYFGTVSSDKLESLLVLEADRMVNTVAGATELKSERTVVLSELDGGNNNPSTRLYRQVMAAAFPNSTYGAPVIGYRSDVEAFSPDQVQKYYQTYYRPDNATLVVVGNFETKALLKKIENIFGKIQSPPVPKFIEATATYTPPAFTGNPIVLKEPGSVAFLQAVYPTLPPVGHPDIAAIDVMDTVLTAGRNSRLYQALQQTGLVSSYSGSASTMIEPGWYIFNATAAQGKSLESIDKVLLAEITKLQTKGVSPEELNRAQTQLQTGYILGNRDVSSQASQLGYNQTVALDYRYSDRYLADVKKVTTADVQRVANQYLNPEKRILGFFEPTAIVATANTGNATSTLTSYTSGTPVDPEEVAKYLPSSTVAANEPNRNPDKPEKFKLPNGLTILLQSDRSSPTVTLVGEIKAGTGFDTEAKAGLASLTAQNLLNGTKTKDALAIASIFEDRGTSLGFSASREGVNLSSVFLTTDLPVIIQQLGDVLQNATFPENELELSLKRNLVSLKSELDNPGSLARRTFQQKLFPKGHPYFAMRTEASLKSIARQDVLNFYRSYYRPDTTTLTLLGDFDPKTVKELLIKEFANWKSSGKPQKLKYTSVSLPQPESDQLTLNGKTQAVTLIGHPSISRSDRRYYAALVLNQVLGGDTLSSRLGTELRDRQGLTYGVYSYFQAGQGAGQFVVQMQTNPQDTQRAIASALEILKSVHAKGITSSELTAAKASLINSFPVDISKPESVASSVLSDEVFGLPVGDFYQFPRKVKAVSLEEVNAAARELLHPDNLVIVTATPPLK
ncbi:putative Zn-dependent peptidase [Synechococcus sp. PCC 7502]|uniref:M16 family metallopeptidase n=1 Tax=Synechococcus sp. PCC 7502 TaxID=1173263 RepID=UPI00029F83D6|nr:pitrilysin family protein [Synechococcus sp. PCC 7502]AFY73952.1 putative Zn-dependent peptidase [Synechococcus sp. PCC 7502]